MDPSLDAGYHVMSAVEDTTVEFVHIDFFFISNQYLAKHVLCQYKRLGCPNTP